MSSLLQHRISRMWTLVALIILALATSVSSVWAHGDADGIAENGLFFMNYRHLNGGADGVALIDLDPESPNYGQILQQVEMGVGTVPHHVYYNSDESRVYNTTLGGEYLYEMIVERDETGFPTITDIVPIDVGKSMAGEDLYFSEDGTRFWMTFLGGFGDLHGGTIGVFDAQSNELIETIVAPVPEDPASGEPFILYPHGISANEDLGYLMVTSTVHPDTVSGAGNTVTLLDMATNKPVQTLLVAESWDDISVPVEVLLLRDEFPPYALATTIGGGDIWVAPYDEETGQYGQFSEAFDGAANNLGVALEFYIGPGEDPTRQDDKLLYVSFAIPGVVNVYSLDELPELSLVKTIPADAGAHHMAFFQSQSGRELLVIQNNLLNLPDQNSGTLTIVDIQSNEVLDQIDLPESIGLLPESLEAATGSGHFYHH